MQQATIPSQSLPLLLPTQDSKHKPTQADFHQIRQHAFDHQLCFRCLHPLGQDRHPQKSYRCRKKLQCTRCGGDHLAYACPLGLFPLIVDGSTGVSAEFGEEGEKVEEEDGFGSDTSSRSIQSNGHVTCEKTSKPAYTKWLIPWTLNRPSVALYPGMGTAASWEGYNDGHLGQAAWTGASYLYPLVLPDGSSGQSYAYPFDACQGKFRRRFRIPLPPLTHLPKNQFRPLTRSAKSPRVDRKNAIHTAGNAISITETWITATTPSDVRMSFATTAEKRGTTRVIAPIPDGSDARSTGSQVP